MKILVVTQYFWPEEFRINDLTKELIKKGHKVTVITGYPNYPDGKIYKEFSSNKNRYSNYEGVVIDRTFILPRGKNKVSLFLNYLSFIFSATIKLLTKYSKDDFDVIFVYEPSPVTVCLPAIFFKLKAKIPIVFWVLDLWPETLKTIGAVSSKALLKVIDSLVIYIYRNCDLILGQSESFCKAIKLKSPDSKIKYFPGWSEKIIQSKDAPAVIKQIEQDNSFKFIFTGNVGEAQDFDSLVSAVKNLKNESLNFIFYIIGEGRDLERIKRIVEDSSLTTHIKFLGRHDIVHMPHFWNAADVLYVSLKDSEVFNMTIPAKIQNYMQTGVPILGMIGGETKKIIESSRCGLVSNSSISNDLDTKIKEFYYMQKSDRNVLGANGINFSSKVFNRDKLITQLEKYFQELTQKK